MNYLPTPYPTKLKFQTIQNPSSNASSYPTQIASLKKEVSELETKVLSLTKLNKKLDKKTKEQGEELKKLKQSHSSLSSDNIILQKSLQKISNEKLNLESTLEENNKYINKLEIKLVNGASNQFLNEQITNLKNQKDSLSETINQLKKEIEKITKDKLHYEQEIKILNKALELKLEDLNSNNKNGAITKEILIDFGLKIEEKNKIILAQTTMKKENESMKKIIKERDEKIQELLFAKDHLTQMLADKDTCTDNYENEKQEYQKTIQQLITERDVLRDCIEKANIQQKAIENDVQFEAKEYQTKINNLQNEISELNQKNLENSTQVEILNKTLTILKNKNIQLESTCKEKVEKYAEQDAKIENLNNKIISLQNDNSNMKIENDSLIQKVNELNEQMHNMEAENLELISKVKSITIDRENCRVDLVKQNLILTQSESKLKNQVAKCYEEIEKLKKEKEEYKNIINDMSEKTNIILQEKKEIEIENNTKNIQIQKLKSNNMFIMKGIGNKINNKEILTTDLSIKEHAKTDNCLYEEEKQPHINSNQIIDMIRKEKEKNKSVMNEIRKIKSVLSSN